MDENRFVNKYVSLLKQGQGVVVGPGDDCAVLDYDDQSYQLFATDQVVGNIHYLDQSTSPADIAGKLLKRNLSDLAAMGGLPAYAVLTMALGTGETAKDCWLQSFFTALNEESRKWNMSVCGGDVSSTDNADDVFTLAILGTAKKEMLSLRCNGKEGEFIVCTGELGNSFSSGHHINFTPRLEEAQFLCGQYTNTMIDISDGLLKDLQRMLLQSKLGAALALDKIPLRKGATTQQALTDGEDYELLFSVAKNKMDELFQRWPFENVTLSVIGELVHDDDCKIVNSIDGQIINKQKTGFDHFEE